MEKVEEFFYSYKPKSELLILEVVWNGKGGFYYVPLEIQKEIFASIGKDNYIFLPKKGTNPRVVEISNIALVELLNHPNTKKIEVFWSKPNIDAYQPFRRWVELWEKERKLKLVLLAHQEG